MENIVFRWPNFSHKGNFNLPQFNCNASVKTSGRLLNPPGIPLFDNKFGGVDPEQQDEHGDQQRPENKADEPKKLDTRNYPEDGDQGVDIAQLFIDQEPKQVVYQPDEQKTPKPHSNTFSYMPLY